MRGRPFAKGDDPRHNLKGAPKQSMKTYIEEILSTEDVTLDDGRRVPRAMLEEIWVEASRFDANGEYKSIDEIAAKHGVVIE